MINNVEANKKAAVQFMKLIVPGKIDEAYDRYVNLAGRHHNAFFAAGFLALREAMKANHIKFPNKHFEIKNVIGENDLIAVMSHITLQSGDKGLAAMHTFRFKNGKITEMWDIVQPIPEQSPNKDGIF